MLIAIIYFSGTGNTQRVKKIIKEELIRLNNDVEEFDITNRNTRQTFAGFDLFDAIIFGFPIYYWRAPRLIRDWFNGKDGMNRRCSLFFTYGGVTTGIAHYDMAQILDAHNFKLIASAEFLAKHTYNVAGFRFMEKHPDEEDYRTARAFALTSYHKFLEDDVKTLLFDPPKKSEEEADKIEFTFSRAIPTPFIEIKLCTECGICEEICPTNAMVIQKGKPQRKTCIRCLKCLFSCPDHAIKMPNMTSHYDYMNNLMKLSYEELKKKKSKIYS